MKSLELSSEFDDITWSMLLDYIANGMVVPVIGAELLTVEMEGRQVSLYKYVAERLAEYLKLDVDLPETASISDIVNYYRDHSRRGMINPGFAIFHILRSVKCSPPKALRQLAEISGFRLFITTTFDDLMLRALNESRSGGSANAHELSFKKKKPDDLPEDFDRAGVSVYHVFGRASNVQPYVITEEDLLDFSGLWQKEDFRPRRLSAFLRDKYLMVLGCSFENWLSRFFLYTLKGNALLNAEERCGVLADDRTRHDEELTLFLSRCYGDVYNSGGAVEFIDELSKRWNAYRAQYGGDTPGCTSVAASREDASSGFMNGSIFISYASEDLAVVESIKEQLTEAGLDAWFDAEQLSGGDAYKRIIFENIKRCSLFMPIISRSAVTRERGYYRMEWDRAVEEAKMRKLLSPFICPIVIDDTKPSGEIHEAIVDATWEPLEDGRLSEEFIARCRKCVRQIRRQEEGTR